MAWISRMHSHSQGKDGLALESVEAGVTGKLSWVVPAPFK